MKIAAWFVDSWIRVKEPDDHIEYRIVLRGENGEEWDCFHRYSSLRQFHINTITNLCSDSTGSVPLTFPDKMVFSRQTDAFTTSRARALDAYLQLLLVKINPQPRSLLDFFNTPFSNRNATSAFITSLKSPTISLKAPKYDEIKTHIFDWSIELRKIDELLGQVNLIESTSIKSDFELDEVMKQVSIRAKLALKEEEMGKNIFEFKRKYFDLKRDYEIYKIKKQTDFNFLNDFKHSFAFPDELNAFEEEPTNTDKLSATVAATDKNLNTQQSLQDEKFASSLRCQINHQEAILSDLSATFQEQKLVSKALAAEIEEHNTFLNSMQSRQDEIKIKFDESNVKVRKIN